MRRAEEIPGAIWANQFDNTANRDGHYATTGAEIWRDTGGRLDAFVAATGTGGTFGGACGLPQGAAASAAHRARRPAGQRPVPLDQVRRAEGRGSGLDHRGHRHRPRDGQPQHAPVDDALHVTDVAAVAMVHRLLRQEGLFLGSAAGVNVAGAVAVARRWAPGTDRTVLCDSGHKYQSRLYNREWLAEKGLLAALDG
jgi:cysteine synthase